MLGVLETLEFDRVYGAWWDRVIPEDGKASVLRSADRYLAALLGMLAVLPLYFGVAFTDSPRSEVFTSHNLGRSLLLAFLVGVPLGVWAWHDDHAHGPTWFDALRYPSSRTAVKLWVAVVPLAAVSYILLPKWTGNWPPDLVIFLAFVLFVIPIVVALLVTLAAARRRGA